MNTGRIVEVRVKKWAWYVLFLLAGLLVLICGCASQARRGSQMDSAHYVAVAETQPQQTQAQRPYQGPVLFGQGSWTDIQYDSTSSCLGTSTYKISSDGNSGSLSHTTIRTYRNTTRGGYGTLVGPAGFYGGYCGY